MGRLNYDFDKRPLEPREHAKAIRRVRIGAIFCAVAVVTGGLIYALVPQKKAEPEKKEVPSEKSAGSPAVPVEMPETPSQNPSPVPAGETTELPAESEAEAKETPEEKEASDESETPEKPETPADPSGKGVVLPSDPPASQDQPVREGAPVSDLETLKTQAASGDLAALTEAFSAAAPGSAAYAQYGLALGVARLRMWRDGSWKESAVTHRVAAGDSLSRLARRHRTTVELIRHANRLKGNNIRIGQKLTILPGPWALSVDKKARLLTIWRICSEKRVAYGAYEIGIGRDGRTPKGEFVISYRLRHPDWHTSDGRVIPYGDKENVLGDYFLKLAVKGKADRPLLGYGIHGTSDETTVGRSLSNGCIRMRGEELEMLYFLLPSGSPVIITE